MADHDLDLPIFDIGMHGLKPAPLLFKPFSVKLLFYPTIETAL
jgi:hypothetical protein